MTAGRLLRLVAVAALALALVPVAPARVAGVTATRIILPASPQVVSGEYGEVQVTLQTATGAPVADAIVAMTLVDNVRRRRTDVSGTALFQIQNDLAPGTYQLIVDFRGSSVYAPAHAETNLIVARPTVDVLTVPALEGIRFSLGQESVLTDAQGIAHIPFTPPAPTEKPAPGDLQVSDRVVARFQRWYGTSASGLTATFALFYDIRFSFTDLAGHPVDRSLITGMTLRNSIGERFEVTNEAGINVQGSRVVSLLNKLESKDVYYTVESVTVSGSNVVNRAQQKFLPSEQIDWNIVLLFYSADITVHDALLGFPIGSAVRLKYPDGKVVELPLTDGEIRVASLPRGDYTLSVIGPGLTISSPLALSRDQDVSLQLISWLDIALGVGGVLLLMTGLLVLGRPSLRRHLGRWTDPGFALERALQAVITGLALALAILFGPRITSYVSLFTGGQEALVTSSQVAAPSATAGVTTDATQPREYEVVSGDTLRSIARRFYRNESVWQTLYDANRQVIDDPDSLVVGTRVVLP